jgi:hypothetical protein
MTGLRVRWTAAADGIAHAHPRARSPWALCGARAVDERVAHPARRRCEACVAAAEKVAV